MILRAPKEHGQILAVPGFDQVGALLERNQQLLSSSFADEIKDRSPAFGKPLPELRSLARREVLELSHRYHRDAGETVAPGGSDRWILAGHQPELFHPGVWFKNFALHQLAGRHGAMPLNLVVDTDSAKPPLLHVPGGGRITRIPYDRTTPETPYEDRIVHEESTFADLPSRIAPFAARWKFEPMLATFWSAVMRHTARTPLLGERFAAGRRAMERRWGCVPHEVPMSRVCQTEAFAWFACGILSRLPTFHDTYNEVVRAYRHAHGIRSRNHPVPDLAAQGDWLEAPFWAWRRGQTRRGRLLVRQAGDAWTLNIGGIDGPTLPAGEPAQMVDAWRTLETQGIKIRTRALTTTLFARLFLADLFIHGIGGGIYDELTDRIIERDLGMPAPAFLVLSATLLLPLERFPGEVERWRRRQRELRDMTYQPDRFLPLQRKLEFAELLREKQDCISHEGANHAERLERFQRIRAINGQLHPLVQPAIDRLQAEQAECRRRMEQDAIAHRRDYAFCLYPEEMLRTFFHHVIPLTK